MLPCCSFGRVGVRRLFFFSKVQRRPFKSWVIALWPTEDMIYIEKADLQFSANSGGDEENANPDAWP